jgi:chromosome segregation ATPase
MSDTDDGIFADDNTYPAHRVVPVPDHDVTPPLDEFLVRYDENDNEWWRLECGHHMNLFEEAVDRMRAAEAEVRRLLEDAKSMAEAHYAFSDEAREWLVRAESAEAANARLRQHVRVAEDEIDRQRAARDVAEVENEALRASLDEVNANQITLRDELDAALSEIRSMREDM